MLEMQSKGRYWGWVGAALVCGLVLRVWFVRNYPWLTGDVLMYGAIAKHWLQTGIYGWTLGDGGGVQPTLIRLPGYPLFVATCFRIFGVEHYGAVMYVQVFFDLGTCLIVASLAGRLAGRRAALAALWLAALCPFTANYTAAALTETMSIFCVALAFYGLERWHARGMGWNRWLWLTAWALLFAVSVRPDEGLLPVAVLPMMAWMGWRGGRRQWVPVVAAALFIGLPFVPWAWRNWQTFQVFQPLAPRYANDPDEVVPRGFQRWYRTWAIDFDSTEEVYWNYDGSAINMEDLPARAFDSEAQFQKTAALMAKYNDALAASPEMNAAFDELATERNRAHPVRTYVLMPVARVADMWLRPRTEMMMIPLEWWQWRGGHRATAVFALCYAVLNAAYLALAGAGVWLWRRRAWSGRAWLGASMLAFVVVRSVLLLTLDNSEPRYTLEFWPIVTVLAAIAVARWWPGKKVSVA